MEFKAKTVADAIDMGLKELGLTEEQVVVKIIEEPTKGFLGILKGNAIVDITEKLTDLQRAGKFLQNILDLITDKSSSVIGYRGEGLDAMQTLAGAMANLGNDEYKKVSVDCEGYRAKREETLISLAHKLEEKATEMRREVMLEPMSPFERRIIHTALADSKTVSTKSDGKEPNRYVVIVPFDKDENSTPYNAGRNREQGRKDSRRSKSGRRDDRKGGKNNNRSSKPMAKSSKTITFGTYLGNSLKDN